MNKTKIIPFFGLIAYILFNIETVSINNNAITGITKKISLKYPYKFDIWFSLNVL